MQHTISCKKGGLETLRHNEPWNNIAEMLGEVTYDVKVEPMLQLVAGEELQGNCLGETRSDVSARRFWSMRQGALLDISIFDTNAQHD